MDFYVDQIFEGEYPEEAAQWCNNQSRTYITEIEPSETGIRRFQIVVAPEPTFEQVKKRKLLEINTACDNILKQAVADYPETEQQTFYKQDAESAAYLEQPEIAETPFLTTLAAARGISLETMVTKVRAKTDAFSRLSAFICGQRQAMEDLLDTCASVEEVEALLVSYQLPEVE